MKIFIPILLFFVFSFIFRTDSSFDQDLGRHMKLGEIVLNSGAVPKTNLFSYTNPEFPFINHHYFFEILVYLGDQLAGVQTLLWLKILIILSAVAITLSLVKKFPVFLTLPIAFIFLHTLRGRTELRPEIFSFLFTAATYYILNRFELNRTKLIWLLPPVQLLWVNTHIYFPIGLVLQAVFLIHFLSKWSQPHAPTKKIELLGIVFTVSIVLSLINPNGISGLLYPLTVFGNYGYTIAENQNLFLLESLNFRDSNFLFVKLSWLLIIISVITGAFRRTLSVKNLLLSLLGLMLSAVHIRSFPYLVFISLPGVIENFGTIRQPKWMPAPLTLISLLIIAESVFYLTGDYYKYTDREYKAEVNTIEHGKGAVDFLLVNNLPQPIFNNFDIGSYIIYRGYPEYKVFVDGRPEAYPKEFFREVYIPAQENPKIFQKLDEKLRFQTIVFSYTDQTPWAQAFIKNIIQNPDWGIVYIDDFMIVLLKNDAAATKKLIPISLEAINPEKFSFTNHASYIRLSIFLLNTGHTKPAEAFAEKSLEVFPDSPTGNLILATIYGKGTDILQMSAAQNYYNKSKSNIWW